MTTTLRRSLNVSAVLLGIAVFATLSMAVDWSSFTDALTAIVPDAVALAGILVAGVMTITLVYAGGRAVINWARRAVH